MRLPYKLLHIILAAENRIDHIVIESVVAVIAVGKEYWGEVYAVYSQLMKVSFTQAGGAITSEGFIHGSLKHCLDVLSGFFASQTLLS